MLKRTGSPVAVSLKYVLGLDNLSKDEEDEQWTECLSELESKHVKYRSLIRNLRVRV